MALVDNQNDRPVSGNQIIITRMCVMIVNTRWASMALSASCMGALPRLSPFVLSSFSVLQPSASAFSLVPFCGRRTGRVLAWKHEIVPSIARSSHRLTRGCWQGWNYTRRPRNPCLSALASSKSLGLSSQPSMQQLHLSSARLHFLPRLTIRDIADRGCGCAPP